ncbi:hypothetical protein M2169_005034 [Streptomyces sp. MJP52]|nr:hypothetical protein [Streptomyces sp. MJP52]
MQPLIDNARGSGRRPEEFARPGEGHSSPDVPSTTCSGSRVVPALLAGARPGGSCGRYHEVRACVVRERRVGSAVFRSFRRGT